jgi:hypothetical protein
VGEQDNGELEVTTNNAKPIAKVKLPPTGPETPVPKPTHTVTTFDPVDHAQKLLQGK